MFTQSKHRGWALTIALVAGLQGLASRPAAAQQDTVPETTGGVGRARFILGLRSLDLTDLNERMVGTGLTAFDEGFLSMGGSLLTERNRLLVGVEGYLLLGTEPLETQRTSALLGAVGQVDLGYLLHAGERFDVWPTLGLGGGAVGFDVTRFDDPRFDDVITEPGQGSRLESSGLLADLSLGMEYRFGEEKGLAVGLSVGYTRALGDWNWKVDGVQDVISGPDVAIQGLHVALSLGGWS
ncbi:MAG TPA: hypothetical protein VLA36_04380 [Longimicrobiales bacterium]|nr:hypothetical protein [Longimicrobiales bacterium]